MKSVIHACIVTPDRLRDCPVGEVGGRKTKFGIHTLDDLKGRCRVTPEQCWEFALQSDCREPRVWVAGAAIPPARAAWLLAGKDTPRGGWRVWSVCRGDRCCNPGHLRVGTHAAHGRWLATKGTLRGRPERAAINRRIKIESGQARLTPELARWIRESPQLGYEVARVLDVSISTVSKVRVGKAWAETAPAASVFSWATQFMQRAA